MGTHLILPLRSGIVKPRTELVRGTPSSEDTILSSKLRDIKSLFRFTWNSRVSASFAHLHQYAICCFKREEKGAGCSSESAMRGSFGHSLPVGRIALTQKQPAPFPFGTAFVTVDRARYFAPALTRKIKMQVLPSATAFIR